MRWAAQARVALEKDPQAVRAVTTVRAAATSLRLVLPPGDIELAGGSRRSEPRTG